MDFIAFPKIPRLSRECVITEKLDGTNASIHIAPHGNDKIWPDSAVARVQHEGAYYAIRAGSRTRWITPENDNYGFARWVQENADELVKLGEGHHFGEWWGGGIQRRYGLTEKRFSLFNVHRWSDDAVRPACCHVVPTLYVGDFDTSCVRTQLERLEAYGSVAVPGFMDPEGIMIYHTAAGQYFKKTIKGDEKGKGE